MKASGGKEQMNPPGLSFATMQVAFGCIRLEVCADELLSFRRFRGAEPIGSSLLQHPPREVHDM